MGDQALKKSPRAITPTLKILSLPLLFLLTTACKSDGSGGSPKGSEDPPPAEEVEEIQSGYVVQIQTPTSVSTVPRTLAGANFLATRDRLEGTFGPRAEELDVTLLRWPGGGLTETWEDFLNAYIVDAHARDWSTFSHEEPWSLEAFLEWTDDRDIVPTVVLPIKRYVSENGETVDLERMGKELGAFVHQATSGRFGPQEVLLWELGNEFFWGEARMSAEVYTQICTYLLPILQENAAYPIQIGIQAGRLGDSQIGRVADGFSDEQKDQVGFLIDHIYPRNFEWDTYDSRFRLYQVHWGDKPVYISEWNQKSDGSGDPSDFAWGIEQPAPMLRAWDSMVRNNVEYGAFWAIQQNNYTSAYAREGEHPEMAPYIGGVMFDWLTDTVGMEQLDAIQLGQSGLYASAYRSGGDLTIFVAGLEAGEQQVHIDIPGYNITSREGIRMSGERDVRRQTPVLDQMSPLVSGETITFTVNSKSEQELVRIKLAGYWD